EGTMPAESQGVRVEGSRTFDTYFARVIGQNQITASTGASAVTGTVTTPCPPGSGGRPFPITIPSGPSHSDNKRTLPPRVGPVALPRQRGHEPGQRGDRAAVQGQERRHRWRIGRLGRLAGLLDRARRDHDGELPEHVQAGDPPAVRGDPAVPDLDPDVHRRRG